MNDIFYILSSLFRHNKTIELDCGRLVFPCVISEYIDIVINNGEVGYVEFRHNIRKNACDITASNLKRYPDISYATNTDWIICITDLYNELNEKYNRYRKIDTFLDDSN